MAEEFGKVKKEKNHQSTEIMGHIQLRSRNGTTITKTKQNLLNLINA